MPDSFTSAQIKIITSVIVAGVVAGIGYWQWTPPHESFLDEDMPMRYVLERIEDEAKHIRVDFDALKERVDRMNTLQQIILERWDVQEKTNLNFDERMGRQERK